MSTLGARLAGFARFWYDFVVGDDWRVASGIVAVLAASAGLAHAGLPAWWLPPAGVLGVLALSLRRATRPPRR